MMLRSVMIGLLAMWTVGAGPHRSEAQSASSPGYFLVGTERASGGACTSTTFLLDAALGAGIVPERAVSVNYVLHGGFVALIGPSTSGRPWASGVSPLYGPLLGGTGHSVHGTELDLGPTTSVAVGGLSASVSARTKSRVSFVLPAQSSPGWKSVSVTNAGGTATLPKGIGVLPLVETPQPVAINEPFRITYRGQRGDIVYLAVANARFPAPIPLAPYHHGLELNPGALLGLVGPLPVLALNGELHLDFPGLAFPRPLYVQFLGVTGSTPGYQPGSFTNLLRL